MSESGFWGGALLAGLIVAGIYEFNQSETKTDYSQDIGRYQIIDRGDWKGWLLDTATGETWEWVHMNAGTDNEYRKWSKTLSD